MSRPITVKGRDRHRLESQTFRIAARIAARRRREDRHTRGPWGALAELGSYEIGVDYPEGDERDHYLCTVMCGDPDELLANARLIRAAPQMLDACRVAEKILDSVAFVSSEGDTEEPLRLLREALRAVKEGAPQ